MMVFELCDVEDLFGPHRLQSKTTKDYKLFFGESRIEINSVGSALSYKRYAGADLAAEAMIVSNEDPVMIGVFPIPPLFTPTAVAKNVFLKFNTSVIVDQRSQAVVYAKMPVEIGIYRQSKDEEVLLDSFSRKRQQYALYGSPESGVVCRYIETEVSMIKNDIDNIVKVSKVIIPMDGVVLDHAHDDAWLPGSVEMDLSTSFGKDMVHVRLMSTKVKRSDKTSIRARKDETLVFLMDAGY